MSDTITRSIDIDGTPDQVWTALTDHRQFCQWFRVDLAGPFAIGKATEGTMTYPGHEGAPFVARAEEMDAPRRFVFTWPPGGITDPAELWTRVQFDLTPTAAGTRLTVTESGFDGLPDDRRASIMRGNTEGWQIQTANLRDHVERG